ncbi:IS3 family transposase [Salmonella enterica]|nr:IS3 family transposase [Salmonella enterica]EBD7601109.1 IS3 family transposase [Salmonella enterica]
MAIPFEIKQQGQTWLLPPYNWAHRRISKALGVSASMVSLWRNELVNDGLLEPYENPNGSNNCSPEKRFTAVIETSSMTELELVEYCRSKGIFVEQINEWRALAIQALDVKNKHQINKELSSEQQKVKKLQAEIARKDKALAETTALLVLRGKVRCPLGQQRGRLTPLSERHKIISLILEAVKSGARKKVACECIGVSIRTFQRWLPTQNQTIKSDRRGLTHRPPPHNKLSKHEVSDIIDICNSPEFAYLPPNQIVPSLADKGIYIASESTFYRVLRASGLLAHRSRTRPKKTRKRPDEKRATGPNQVWSWDITYLPSKIKGKHFYLYMILDIYSRKIVGAEVYEKEKSEYAAALLQRTVWSEKCSGKNIVLHSDNGTPMRGYTMVAKMQDLGILSSYSRPRISNDNPYSESLFRVLKCCPKWPLSGFDGIVKSRHWVAEFIQWYNTIHKHSGIKYVTPDERHKMLDIDILRQRELVYEKARDINPSRWAGSCRNWKFINEVYLNPKKEVA